VPIKIFRGGFMSLGKVGGNGCEGKKFLENQRLDGRKKAA